MKNVLADWTISQLEEYLLNIDQPKYRAKQIMKSIYLYKDFAEMSDIPKQLREKLSEDFIAKGIEIIDYLTSKDGTIKFLFKLYDGNVIEGVLMKYKYGNTQCISTQVGCRMGCKFCASGLDGLIRNLSSGEILSQVIAVNAFLGGNLDKRAVTNLVLMGSGEPLDNYQEVITFLKRVSSEDCLNISARNISLSTSGLVPNIYKLADESFPLNLTISLHNPFDEERSLVMPVGKKYKIQDILNACTYYFEKTGRRYIFEYVLIKGVSNTQKHAEGLIKILKGRPCLVNLIRLNEVKENPLETVTEKDAYKFQGMLEKGGINATLRRQIGVDIEGACGQLRRKYIEGNI